MSTHQSKHAAKLYGRARIHALLTTENQEAAKLADQLIQNKRKSDHPDKIVVALFPANLKGGEFGFLNITPRLRVIA